MVDVIFERVPSNEKEAKDQHNCEEGEAERDPFAEGKLSTSDRSTSAKISRVYLSWSQQKFIHSLIQNSASNTHRHSQHCVE